MLLSKITDSRKKTQLGRSWGLVSASILLTMALQGCNDKDPEEEKKCNQASDENSCTAKADFCYWVGCEGETYTCTSGDWADTTCTCETYINTTNGESCPSGTSNRCDPTTSDGCNCKMCTKESVESLGFGRQYTTDSGALTAKIVVAPDSSNRASLQGECDWSCWPVNDTHELAPEVNSDEELDTEISLYYRNVGLAEHASVASFARAVLELMGHGAPPGIVDRTLAAAREEVHHAQMAFALARAWSSNSFYVTGIDGMHAEPKGEGLADFARRTITEACAGETPAVLKMAVAYRFVQNVKVREYIRTVLVEERRHAELAWATVAWALLTEAQNIGSGMSREQGVVSLTTANALDSTTASLWLQANRSAFDGHRPSKNEDSLLQVGILPPHIEAAIAQVAAPMVQNLRMELLSKHLVANGLEYFESLVHQHFDHALMAINDVFAGNQTVDKQLV